MAEPFGSGLQHFHEPASSSFGAQIFLSLQALGLYFTDPTNALANSLKAAAALDESIQFISMSPAGARKAQSSAQSEQRHNAISSNTRRLADSPSSNGILRRGAGYSASTDSSPTTSRHQEIMESPSWRRGEGFVRQSAGVDDPFVSTRVVQDSSLGE